jgi:hypothetical protein
MSNFFRDDKRAIQLEGPRHVKKNTYSYYIVVSRLKRLPCTVTAIAAGKEHMCETDA